MEKGYLIELSRQKIVLNFYFEVENLCFNFAFFVFFLYDLFTNKARKLEVAESNLIRENIPISHSLSVG